MTLELAALAAGLTGWIAFIAVLWLRARKLRREQKRAYWEGLARDEERQYPVRLSMVEALRRYECSPAEVDAYAAKDGWEPLQHHAGYGRKKGNRRVVR